MWALFILASCGPIAVQVAPERGEVLPPNPSLYVTLVDPAKLRVEDSEGAEVPFTSVRLAGDFVRLTVQASDGAEFFLVLPEPEKRRGPFRVSRASATAFEHAAPRLSAGDEFAYSASDDANGWALVSSHHAPVWELELDSNGKLATAFDLEPFVGKHGCGRRTYSWTDEEVSVRVRGLFFDGTVGEWSNSVLLAKPTPSLFAPLRRFISDGGLVPVVIVSAPLLAMALGVVIAVRRNRKRLSE